jgi:hypothetical protein
MALWEALLGAVEDAQAVGGDNRFASPAAHHAAELSG